MTDNSWWIGIIIGIPLILSGIFCFKQVRNMKDEDGITHEIKLTPEVLQELNNCHNGMGFFGILVIVLGVGNILGGLFLLSKSF